MEFSYTVRWDRAGRWSPQRVTIDLEHADPDDLMMRLIRRNACFYEIDLLEHLLVRGPTHGVFVDVGANIGNHSVFFGKFMADHVVAVEPSPVARACLEKNLRANDIGGRSTVVACGVGAVAGRARAVAPEEHPHNLGTTRLSDDRDGDIEVRTLDEVVAEHVPAPVSLVKIDVEGMELDVLRGASRLLEEQRPQIVIETDRITDAERVLGAHGYRCVGRFCATPTYHFTDPGRHARRTRPSGLAYRLVRSWTRGALKRWRARGIPGTP